MDAADLHLPLDRLSDGARDASLQSANTGPEEEEYQKQEGA